MPVPSPLRALLLATVIGASATAAFAQDTGPISAQRMSQDIRILASDSFQGRAPGTPGEIVHRSPQLMLGYWDKPEETAAAFAGGWFHSGDVGVMDAEGYLTVVARVKDVIKTGGIAVATPAHSVTLYSSSMSIPSARNQRTRSGEIGAAPT